jgi:hypothetical protein
MFGKVLVDLQLNLTLPSRSTPILGYRFRPSHRHPYCSAYAKYRFSVTPGTGTRSKLFNKRANKITEPEQGWFRHEPLLELISYFLGCDHYQMIHQPVKCYFWHVFFFYLSIPCAALKSRSDFHAAGGHRS